METTLKRAALGIALGGAAWPALAAAQTAGDDWTAMSRSQLRPEVQRRHDEAVAAMAQTFNANDPRYIWAMAAKNQCGIALGFLKSGTRDPVSLGKCADAYARMSLVPAGPAPLPQVSTVTPEICRQPIIGTVFFEFDSSAVPESSLQTLQFIAANMNACGWGSLNAVGHADRSGSDAYNEGLALRRAEAVAAALGSAGLAPGTVSVSGKGETEPRVPTADGVREAQNRRVEISAR
ncbi:MAG: OmpA family protein [Novosphingobium sp.]|nr:OmpA family protein [Novosphingobium sp.]